MVKIIKPRLAFEAVVSNGVVKAVRCRAEIDAGVEITFIGAAEEADARLKKADKPSEGGGQHAKMAEEVKAAYPRVEKIQPAEETKAAERRLEVERQAEYVVEGLEKEEAGFETGDASVDYGRFAEEVKREFGKLPVYVGVEDGLLYVKLLSRVDNKQFRRYVETCKRLGFRFEGGRWVKRL